ncbi:MAG: carbohydrate kinase family protein, partial [Phycisphaerae bacterium]|nr:carbohydrate kinase family protein [Phycisphaerae bacterium]
SFLHCPGANRTFGFEDMDFDLVAGARLMHLGYPPSMDRLCREDAVELHAIYRKCRELGVTTSLDLCAVDPGSPAARLDWRRIFQRILPEVDIFQPSLDELCQMLQVSPTQEAQHLHHLAGELLAMGCAVVVIKLGESGIYVQTTSSATRLAAAGRGLQTVQPEAWLDQKLHHPCFVANFVSATGAGDCTIAGLLAAVLRGEPAAQAIRSACAVGACSVEAPDATSGVPAWEQVQARLDAGWETHPTPSPFRLRAG